MNEGLEGFAMNESLSILRYYRSICMEGLRENMKISVRIAGV
jgi:hypothetical protein